MRGHEKRAKCGFVPNLVAFKWQRRMVRHPRLCGFDGAQFGLDLPEGKPPRGGPSADST